MRIFFGGPFAKYVDQKNCVKAEKKALIKDIIYFLKKKDHTVKNAHEREAYGKKWMQPNECTTLDLEEIKKCDMFIAMPGNPASGGVHIELGWASALNKKIILLLEKNGKYSNLIHGLNSVSDVKKIEFEKTNEIFEKLDSMI